jgi:hypothetical protein
MSASLIRSNLARHRRSDRIGQLRFRAVTACPGSQRFGDQARVVSKSSSAIAD